MYGTIFGPIEPLPEQVTFGDWGLCKPCSRGLHADHEPTNCMCDLEGDE